MEIGVYTFAELSPDPAMGRVIAPAQRMRDLVEEVELADEVGLEVLGVDEHRRPDFAVSSPAVVLGDQWRCRGRSCDKLASASVQ
jgi:hypothetical protein